MAKNNKYKINIIEIDASWQAQIIRQVTSKKTKITKQQGDFATEAEAKKWANTELKQLLATLVNRNQRHGENRKQNAEIVEQRSLRRAEKTAQVKAQKKAKETQSAKEKETNNDTYASDTPNGIDPEVDYDFNEFSEQS